MQIATHMFRLELRPHVSTYVCLTSSSKAGLHDLYKSARRLDVLSINVRLSYAVYCRLPEPLSSSDCARAGGAAHFLATDFARGNPQQFGAAGVSGLLP